MNARAEQFQSRVSAVSHPELERSFRRLAIVMRRYMVDVRRSRRFLSFGRKHVKSIDGASNGANSCRIRKLYKLQWTQMLHRIRQSRRQFAPNEFDLIWHQFRVERDRTRGDRREMGHRVVLRLESTMQSINGPLLPATHFSLHTKPFSLYLGPHFYPRESPTSSGLLCAAAR